MEPVPDASDRKRHPPRRGLLVASQAAFGARERKSYNRCDDGQPSDEGPARRASARGGDDRAE